jgi:hypothetical protein
LPIFSGKVDPLPDQNPIRQKSEPTFQDAVQISRQGIYRGSQIAGPKQLHRGVSIPWYQRGWGSICLPCFRNQRVFGFEAECNIGPDLYHLHERTIVRVAKAKQNMLAAHLIGNLGRTRIRNCGTLDPSRLDIGRFRETMGLSGTLLCGTQDRISNKINAAKGINGAARQD